GPSARPRSAQWISVPSRRFSRGIWKQLRGARLLHPLGRSLQGVQRLLEPPPEIALPRDPVERLDRDVLRIHTELRVYERASLRLSQRPAAEGSRVQAADRQRPAAFEPLDRHGMLFPAEGTLDHHPVSAPFVEALTLDLDDPWPPLR